MDAALLAERVGPVLAFLVAVTIVAEISDEAGVFDVAAHWAARAGRHRRWRLWALVVALACVSTMVLSLDTTAVLLTPVVITLARQVGMSAAPFVMATVWLANTASLLLPVSNLTNLLALHQFHALGVDFAAYVSLMWRPALAAIAATVVVLATLHRSHLRGQYAVEPPAEPHDRVLLLGAAAVCLALGPVFATGIVPAVPAGAAAVLLLLLATWRDRTLLRRISVPWATVVGVCVLFVVIDVAGRHGLTDLLRDWAGTGAGGADLLRVAGVGAGSANLVNNLPAYLALEPVADTDPTRLAALLVGVNCGPLITVWASLATLLWRDRCHRAGVRVSLRRMGIEGAVCAVAAVSAATLALALG
jgi:arsenical pump membrane protein